MPSKRLMPNICAVCGQELTLNTMEDVEEENAEKTYKLSCGHLYPFKSYIIKKFTSVIYLYVAASLS